MNKNTTNIQVALFPLARTTFSMPDAEAQYRRSRRMLREIFGAVVCPETLLTSPEAAGAFADSLTVVPDLIIYQCNTFVGADFVTEITRRLEAPVLVWSVGEPSIDGGRLKLNSLTGAFSAANYLHEQGRSYRFLLGNPEDGEVMRRFGQILSTLETVRKLRALKVGVVGVQPAGFEFGAVDGTRLADRLGVQIVTTEVADILERAAACPSETVAAALDELKTHTRGWEAMPAETLERHARLRGAYRAFIDENGLQAVASRCWPDFFAAYGTAVCTVLSLLNDSGTATSCEADIPGAISMFIGAALTGGAVYFGDPVAVDKTCNGLVFWHCGAGATTLARAGEGARLGVHPNRKIGPALEFGLKSGRVTVLRLGKSRDGFRLMAMAGEALDEPQKFCGTSVAVRPETGLASEKVAALVRDGWEPHFVVAYGDIMEELQWMCELLNLEFLTY
jgi:L-fucose isomerase-like protein